MTRLSNSFFTNWLFQVLLLRVDTLQSYLVRVHDLCRGWGGGGQEFFQLVFRGGLWKISANVTEGFKGGIAKKLQQKPLLCFPPFSRELFVSL